MNHLKAIHAAANSTPETNIPPIDAIMKHRVEQYVYGHDLTPDMIEHLEAIYLAAMQDASVRLCQLFEEAAA